MDERVFGPYYGTPPEQRERVQNAHPELPTERLKTLTATE